MCVCMCILVGILQFRHGILTIKKENAFLLSYSSVANSLYFKLMSKLRNKAFRFDAFSFLNSYFNG